MSNDLDYYLEISSIYGLLIFLSVISISISSPETLKVALEFLKSKRFITHFSLILIIIFLINFKMYKLKKNGENNARKRLKSALEQAFVAFLIAVFARLDIVFLPFYFVFILVYFVHPNLEKES